MDAVCRGDLNAFTFGSSYVLSKSLDAEYTLGVPLG